MINMGIQIINISFDIPDFGFSSPNINQQIKNIEIEIQNIKNKFNSLKNGMQMNMNMMQMANIPNFMQMNQMMNMMNLMNNNQNMMENNNDLDDKINLGFIKNSERTFVYISRQKLINEAINLYRLKSGDTEKEEEFFFNTKKLNPNKKISEAGLFENSTIEIYTLNDLPGGYYSKKLNK